MDDAALRAIDRLEHQLRTMRILLTISCWGAGIALCAAIYAGWMAHEAANPDHVRVGDTVLDHRGVHILDRSGPELTSTRLTAKGLTTGDQRGYTQVSGSKLSMHPNQRPEVLEEPPVLMFVIDGAAITNK